MNLTLDTYDVTPEGIDSTGADTSESFPIPRDVEWVQSLETSGTRVHLYESRARHIAEDRDKYIGQDFWTWRPMLCVGMAFYQLDESKASHEWLTGWSAGAAVFFGDNSEGHRHCSHGGAMAALCETMARNCAMFLDPSLGRCRTDQITLRYQKPGPMYCPLLVRARVIENSTGRSGRYFEVEELHPEEGGEVVLKAKILVTPEMDPPLRTQDEARPLASIPPGGDPQQLALSLVPEASIAVQLQASDLRYERVDMDSWMAQRAASGFLTGFYPQHWKRMVLLRYQVSDMSLTHTGDESNVGFDNKAYIPMLVTDVVFTELAEGSPGCAHHAAAFTVLDTVLSGVGACLNEVVMTGELSVTYNRERELPIGKWLRVEAMLRNRSGRKFTIIGQLVDPQSRTLYAEAEGLWISPRFAHKLEMAGKPSELQDPHSHM
eukprot:Clim_evm88s172 gene=Clim_evmTU88s172